MQTKFWFVVAAFFLIAANLSAIAQETAAGEKQPDNLQRWNFTGELTGVYEYYDASGATGQAPYQFLEDHKYVDYNLWLSKDVSRYEKVRASMFGTVSYSEYRHSEFKDVIIERANVQWQKGDAAIPFRVEAGDYFSFFSLRTMQRGLKGALIDLQPVIQGSPWRHSVQSFWGVPEAIYREIDMDKEIFAGGSWLISHPTKGDYALSAVYNYRSRDAQAGERDQVVASVSGEREFRIAGQRMRTEVELANFSGDAGTNGSDLRRNTIDQGYFAELRGWRRGQALSYGLLLEQYGEHFRPQGASVSADRRTYEARARYRFQDGLQLRGRLQRFEDGWEQINPTYTHTVGADLSGPFNFFGLGKDILSGSINSYVSNVYNRDRTSETTTYSTSGDFSLPINDRINANANASITHTHDDANNTQSDNRQYGTGLDFSFQTGLLSGLISPRMVFRDSRSSSNRTFEYGPSVGFDLAGGGHSLSFDYNYLFQDGYNVSPADTFVHSIATRYQYVHGRHTMALEGQWQDRLYRDTSSNTETESFRIAATYTFRFSAPSQPLDAGPQPGDSSQADTFNDGIRLIDLPPGLRRTKAVQRLAEAGIQGPVSRNNILTYDVSWLASVDQRQRLVLEFDGDRVQKTALLFSLDDAGDRKTAEQTYQLVRALFVRRYGQPITYDQGDFSGDFRRAVNADQLVRIAQWRLPQGVLRVGIPHRLDRRVQIEVHYTRTFPDLQQTRWALNKVR